MGAVLFIVLLVVEVGFLVWSLVSKHRHTPEKSIVRITCLALVTLLLATGVFTWGFRYYAILIVLGIQAILGVANLLKKREKAYTPIRIIGALLGSTALYLFALTPVLLFPQYAPILPTGNLAVEAADYVWTDPSRVETFTETGENRSVEVAFWYPREDGQYPLVVFSHGAFGFAGSNQSTFEELASHGYVVASIGHPYHAFYAKGADNSTVLVDMNFLNSVYAVNAMEDGMEKQAITDEWMAVRLGDEAFILDTIAQYVQDNPDDELFGKIDPSKTGLFGHSLGGAVSAETGRQRTDVDAVVVLDGTMLGEVLDVDGSMVLRDDPFPIPLLNLYAENHYREALLYADSYPNFHTAARSEQAFEAVVDGAGHLNFTDLPLFSPLLGKLLGTGSIDARHGIETTNQLVLQFFDYALKDGPKPQSIKDA